MDILSEIFTSNEKERCLLKGPIVAIVFNMEFCILPSVFSQTCPFFLNKFKVMGAIALILSYQTSQTEQRNKIKIVSFVGIKNGPFTASFASLLHGYLQLNILLKAWDLNWDI